MDQHRGKQKNNGSIFWGKIENYIGREWLQ